MSAHPSQAISTAELSATSAILDVEILKILSLVIFLYVKFTRCCFAVQVSARQ
jgi:hypothetical protein